MGHRFFAGTDSGLQDADATAITVELRADRRFGSLKLESGFTRYVPAVDSHARALRRKISQYFELAQIAPACQCQSATVPIGPRLHIKGAPGHPDFGVDGSCALTHEGELALVHLGQHFVSWS